MSLIKHFLIRDFKDTSVTWMILAFVTIFSFMNGPIIDGMPTLVVLGYAFFFFFIIQLNQIWAGAFGRSIAREYLLSLPVSRKTLFGMMWIRSLVGALPLAILIFYIRSVLQHDFKVEVNDGAFLLWEVGMVAQLLAIFTNANNSQAALMMGIRKKRYIGFLKSITTIAIDSAFALLWCFAFFNKDVPAVFGILSIAYLMLKMRIAYIKWLWGDEAKFFKKR